MTPVLIGKRPSFGFKPQNRGQTGIYIYIWIYIYIHMSIYTYDEYIYIYVIKYINILYIILLHYTSNS